MEERLKFIAAYLESDDPFAELCKEFGISRQNGYKWVRRYEKGGPAALVEQSRRPLTNCRAVRAPVAELIVAMRKKRPRWGPRKLLAVLEREYPEVGFPVASTVGAILRAKGLVATRRRRPPISRSRDDLGGYERPNAVWCADFKGHFLVGGRPCYPLTISDGYSRYLLRCVALHSTIHDPVRKIFIDAFREFGMPDAIRTDNGPPFVSVTTGGLSHLAVWWILLGIQPQRILPGRPDQNGRHERMHRTLKAETAQPPAPTFKAQQSAFETFIDDYNHHRPHEALGQVPPATFYRPSRRKYTGELRDPEYPSHFDVRRAYPNGVVSIAATQWYVSRCVANQRIGFEPIDEDCWRVYFGPLALGLIDLRRTVKRNVRNFGLLLPLPNTRPRRKSRRRR